MHRLLRALVTLLALGGAVEGHGFLASPAARNVQHNSDYCPQCLNGNGPWTVFAGGRKRYGVCGDPWNGARNHEAGGRYATPPRVAAVYRAGQVFTARVTLTANHLGRWSLGLCRLPSARMSPASERAATTQRCFKLLQRADGRGPYTPVPGGAYSFAVRYRLPRGVRCKRCVMQWYYETANSCTIPGTPGNMPSCATSRVQELFWNCADVAIV